MLSLAPSSLCYLWLHCRDAVTIVAYYSGQRRLTDFAQLILCELDVLVLAVLVEKAIPQLEPMKSKRLQSKHLILFVTVAPCKHVPNDALECRPQNRIFVFRLQEASDEKINIVNVGIIFLQS